MSGERIKRFMVEQSISAHVAETVGKRQNKITRRDFLKVGGIVSGATALLVACGPDEAKAPGEPTQIPDKTKTPEPIDRSFQILDQDQALKAEVPAGFVDIKTVFASFQKDPNVNVLFSNPDSVQYSAMGVKYYSNAEKKRMNDAFFSAVSETDQKAYIAWAYPTVDKVPYYAVLNRVVGDDGKIGLAVTQNLKTGQDLKKPFIIFSTDLTLDQVAKMTNQEINQHNLIFMLGNGEQIPQDKLYGKVGLASAYLPSPIATETPTATAEAPMTVAEVESLYTGIFPTEGTEGGTLDAAVSWKKIDKTIYTSADYDTIKNLKPGTSITIFERNKITCIADPLYAAEAASHGAIIVVSEGVPIPSKISKLSLAVSNRSYENGNRNIQVVFGEVTGHMDTNPAITLEIKTWLKEPGIVPMPKHFKVTMYNQAVEALTPEEAGLTGLTDANWILEVTKAGFTGVLVFAQK